MSQPLRVAPGTEVAGTEPIALGRAVVRQEVAALEQLSRSMDGSFRAAVELIEHCQGSIIITGMGKAGLVGQKVAATLASTGSRSHFLHPAEAIHGDLGRIHHDDVVVLLSYSGRTSEIVQLLPSLRQLGVRTIAITGRHDNPLAGQAHVTLAMGEVREACPLQLAPSASTTAMMALGDALALTVSQRRGFTRADFARFHPGGALGQRLARVDDWMRPCVECRVAHQDQKLRDVLMAGGRPGRRSGAILVTDNAGRLTGIFTDSDLARLLERQQDFRLDHSINRVMTDSPTTVLCGTMLDDAVKLLQSRKISELPVVDVDHRPLGLIDITDVISLMPNDETSSSEREDRKPDAVESRERT